VVEGFPWNPTHSVESRRRGADDCAVTRPRFRLAVVLISVAAAVAGGVVLATRDTGVRTTTTGIAERLHLPGHPGAVAAGSDAVWLALADTRSPVRDEPLLRFDLASGRLQDPLHFDGQASYLLHDRETLLASVEHVGVRAGGPSSIVALDWHSGDVIRTRPFPAFVGPLAASGDHLWALEVNPATLLRLDRSTLRPTAAPLSLSAWQGQGLAAGDGYVWATVPETGDVLRIDPRTGEISRAHVGGFPDGVAVIGRTVWFARRDRGEVARLAPGTLRPVGSPIHVGGDPTWLARAGSYLLVGDAAGGVVRRVDVRSLVVSGLPIRVAANADAEPVFPGAAASGSVWVGDFASRTLIRISTSGEPSTHGVGLPPAAKVVATIRLGHGRPAPSGGGAFAIGEGAVWAVNSAESTLMRIDPGRNTVVARVKVPPTEDMAAGDGAVWLTNPQQDTVTRVDTDRNAVASTIHVGFQPLGIAVTPGAVWVADAGGPSVGVIDPRTNKLVKTISIGSPTVCCSEHMSLTVGPSGVWVEVPNEHALVRIDPVTRKRTGTVRLPYCDLGAIVVDSTTVWSDGGTCSPVVGKVALDARRLTGELYEPHPVGLGFASGSVWVALVEVGDVDRIDPATARVTARLHVGGYPVRIAVGFGSVWVEDDNGRVLRLQPMR
jgi:DNA-binding beta-propeller fold protein YncE